MHQLKSLLLYILMSIVLFSCQSSKQDVMLEEVARSEKLWTGVAISKEDDAAIGFVPANGSEQDQVIAALKPLLGKLNIKVKNDRALKNTLRK